jgi:hypothetical protein
MKRPGTCGKLLPILLEDKTPPVRDAKVNSMSRQEIQASLVVPSAKIWPRERDDNKTSLFTEDRLAVPRWEQNEQYASINKGFWRRSPIGGELEIKGALLGRDGTEYVPPGKRDRSYQIFHYGFT